MSSSLPKSLRPKETSQQNVGLKSLRPKQVKNQEQQIFFENDEDLDREIERNQAQFTSRMLERLFGSFGNAYQMTPDVLKKIQPLNFAFKHLPTEKKLREFSEKASLGYTKPKTAFEEKTGEFAGDVASFATGGGRGGLLRSLSTNLGIPLASNLVKEGIEKIGGEEGIQNLGKYGTMLLLDLWDLKRGHGGGAKKLGETLLDASEKSIPKDALANVSIFQKSLGKLKNTFKGGVTGPHTSEALRVIDEIEGHIKNGQMEAWRFPKIRKDINKIIDSMKGFSLTAPPIAVKKTAVNNLNQVKQSLIQAGNRWGRGNNSEFFKNWRGGNEALSVFHKSNDIANFIAKKTKIKNPVLKTAFGVHAYHHPIKTLALHAAKKTVESTTRFPSAMIYRMMNSKVLRKLYGNILRDAMKGSASSVISGIEKMEKEMEKEKIK